MFWHVVRTAPAQRDPAALARALQALDPKLDIAEQRLASHAFLAGEHFTPADIQLGHVLYRYFDIDIPRQERPALRRYYESLAHRRAYREHVMVSYQELAHNAGYNG
ncbi:glutathione S-transferase C-terminal domain-containing protein [Bordetella genomosp. 8]|uniref:glutathione S-transferase C-terminal domain-containing protein n=1 Tax=Bordetella genomosp. 8 TaxID=1416806 RepID=UPI0018E015E1|nr:glutathione S-transferase C-terminal domain-containing protein [Bordetella genomosp. 8]